MYQRADEISDLLDELISMNQGTHINNALGLAFKTNQFKVSSFVCVYVYVFVLIIIYIYITNMSLF